MNDGKPVPGPAGAGSLSDAFDPLAPPRLVRDQAFEHVRNAIISGRLPPGARLIEREMCAALGISRTIVREVIRRLEAERLVQVAAHRGPRVTELSVKAVGEIYDLRAELEVLLVRDFVRNGDDALIAALQALMADIRRAADVPDVERLVTLMRDFLAIITTGADNETAGDILETLHARISRVRVLSMSEPGRILQSLDEIAAIIDALARRDGPAAMEATRAYILAARAAALRQIDKPA